MTKVLFKLSDHCLLHFVLPDPMVQQPSESHFEAKACLIFLLVFGACSRLFTSSLFNIANVPLLSVFTLCADLVLLVQCDGALLELHGGAFKFNGDCIAD